MNRITDFKYYLFLLCCLLSPWVSANNLSCFSASLPILYESEIIDTTICEGDCLVFENKTYCTEGSFPLGNARVLKLNLTERSQSISYTICEGESYPNQEDWTTNGRYNYQTAIGACPITVWVNLAVKPNKEKRISEVIEFGECYDFGPNTLCQSGEYELRYATSDGCDSTVYINLTVEDLIVDTLAPVQKCFGETHYVPEVDSILIQSGLYQFHGTNNAGKAILRILDLRIDRENITYLEDKSCFGTPYDFNGQIVDQTGMYQYTTLASNGCDSTVILNLSVGAVTDETITKTILSGQSYIVGKNNISFEGMYEFVFESVAGCDSIIRVDLSIEGSTTATNPTDSVDSNNPIDPMIDPVVPTDSIPDGGIDTNGSTSSQQEICDGMIRHSLCFKDLPYRLGNNTFWEGGIFNLSYNAPDGCSDNIQLELIVERNITTLTEIICEGSYTLNNKEYSTTGIFRDTIISVNNCDSILILDLTAATPKDTTIEKTICWGEPFISSGIYITDSGLYTETYQTTYGCDSLVSTMLTIEGGANSDVRDSTLCAGEHYADDIGNKVFVGGRYTFRFVSVAGCDSTVTLDLLIPDTIRSEVDTFFCEGESFTLENFAVTRPGTYRERFSSSAGCDSLVQYNLTTFDCEINSIQEADTIICGGNTGEFSFMLIKGQAPFTYKWEGENKIFSGQDADLNLNTPITEDGLPAGLYSVTVTDKNGIEAILEIEILLPEEITSEWKMPELKGNTYLACPGDANAFVQILPTGGLPPYRYEWSTGQTNTSRISNLPEGAYTVTITDDFNCPHINTVSLTEPPKLALKAASEDPLCENMESGQIEVMSMQGGTAPYQYRLEGKTSFSQEARFGNLTAGDYNLNAKDANECPMDTMLTIVEPEIIELVYDSLILLELGDMQEFDIVSSGMLKTITWRTTDDELSCTDCLDAVASPIESTEYTLTVTSEDDCETTINLTIKVSKERDVFIPNVFSPNSDGINDRFSIFGGPEVASVDHFSIYSRWGELLFESDDFEINDNQKGWDGFHKGKKMKPGVYIYLAQLTFIDGVEEQYTGDVLLAE